MSGERRSFQAGTGRLVVRLERALHGQTAVPLKEAVERSTHWSHATTALFVFASDFVKPIIPNCTRKVALSALALLVVLWLAVKFRILSAKPALWIVGICLVTAILSLAVVGFQVITGDKHGALAALVPGVEELQEKLGITEIKKKIVEVKHDTEALLKGQQEQKAQIEEIKGLLAVGRGGGASSEQVLQAIRKKLAPVVPRIEDVSDNKLADVVQGIVDALQKPGPRPEDFSGAVKQALTEAQAQAADLKFADAAKGLDTALARTEAADKDRARERAALLAERGRIARLQLNYREAAAFYAKAADVLAFDSAAAWRHTLDSALALYAQGDEFGENQALEDAIRVYRSALEMALRARAARMG